MKFDFNDIEDEREFYRCHFYATGGTFLEILLPWAVIVEFYNEN